MRWWWKDLLVYGCIDLMMLWCIGVLSCYMMKWSCNMNYMESCIVESIFGIHASWLFLFNDEYFKTGGLIGNIHPIIQIFKDGGSLGNITLTSETWYHMYIKSNYNIAYIWVYVKGTYSTIWIYAKMFELII